jgi:hypothetical protein
MKTIRRSGHIRGSPNTTTSIGPDRAKDMIDT